MNKPKDFIEVSPKDFKNVLRKIKKDGVIIKNGNCFYVRLNNNADRYKPEAVSVFATPFIGYFEGQRAFINPPKLQYYSNDVA